MHVALSAPTELSLEAARVIASEGGNALDCAVTAAIAATIVEPGICAPGAGGFVTVAGPHRSGAVYDGYLRAPLEKRSGVIAPTVAMEYGGGIETRVGPGSVAVPGAWAALGQAHEDGGRVEWERLVLPVVEIARRGFRLSPVSAYYLQYSNEKVFGADPASRHALTAGGRWLESGDLVMVEDLADTLGEVARHGPDWMYTGELGRHVGQDLAERGGSVGQRDFADYKAVRRDPLNFGLGGWTVSTNPAPAVGGAAVAFLLDQVRHDRSAQSWIHAQRQLFDWRATTDGERDRTPAVSRLVAALTSPSTIHISAVDEHGLAVAITLSAGYGSGVIPTGTGMWMNNGLGEFELVGDDPWSLPAGGRLNSNMAPTVAEGPHGESMAIGGPGADRISTSLAQVLAWTLLEGSPVETAIGAPRLHVDVRNGGRVACEPGIDVRGAGPDVFPYDALHMYFGGVGVAYRDSDGRLSAVSDPRRVGSSGVI